MSKPVKVMTLLCYIYDVDFIYLVAEHKLGVGVDLSGRMDFV